MIEAIRKFIKDELAFDINYIWRGQQNKITPPKYDVDFIILTPLYKSSLTAIVDYQYDESDQKSTFTDLKSTTIQIDIYGQNAFNNADKLNMLFKIKANEYFNDNSYSCSVGHCSEQINMAEVLEQSYLNRQMMKLELFDNTVIISDDGYIDSINADLIFANVQK